MILEVKSIRVLLTVMVSSSGLLAGSDARANDLLGWDSFRFGSSMRDVLQAAGSVAANSVRRPDGTLILYDLTFYDVATNTTFTFGSGIDGERETEASHGKLSSIDIEGIANQKCSEYQPLMEAGLTKQYGAFASRSKPNFDVIFDQSGRPTGRSAHSSGKSYQILRVFDNHAYLYEHSFDSGGRNGIIPECKFYVTFSSQPPPRFFKQPSGLPDY